MSFVWRRFAIMLACLLGIAFIEHRAQAHKPSDAYLTLESKGAHVSIAWHIAIRDLDDAIGLDENGDGTVTGQELRSAEARVRELARGHLAVKRSNDCPLDPGVYRGVIDHSDGTYAVLDFDAACGASDGGIEVNYSLFYDIDPQHRGIFRLGGGDPRVATNKARVVVFDAATVRPHGLVGMAREGVAHIWTGYDHMLFLLALLLPSVLRRQEGKWLPQAELKSVLVDVAKVVTAFTLAHSVTLSLAALGIVALPSRFVESTIALSVVVAAANNVAPFLQEERWLASFVLGLMHGFGFSSTLSDLGLSRSALLVPLVGFNAGVELGQLAVVLVLLPVMFWGRKSGFYRNVVLRGGSILIALVALVWLVERVFEVRVIS